MASIIVNNTFSEKLNKHESIQDLPSIYLYFMIYFGTIKYVQK